MQAMNNGIKAVFFDLDNTLVDFLGVKETSCRAAAEAMVQAGLVMTADDAFSRLMEKYFAVGIESDSAFSEFLKAQEQFNHKILAAAINAYLDAKGRCLKPYPNVKAVLSQLQKRGIYISVVTDAPKTKAYQRLLGMGIESYFRFVVGYEDTGCYKNTCLPLMLALELLRKELLNIENGEILMVGDSLERDILPAKQLGLKTALSLYGQKTASLHAADYELGSFEDLLKLF
jgi:putative hydrolase of the HAD superfamily